jgi:hypothetical protein
MLNFALIGLGMEGVLLASLELNLSLQSFFALLQYLRLLIQFNATATTDRVLRGYAVELGLESRLAHFRLQPAQTVFFKLFLFQSTVLLAIVVKTLAGVVEAHPYEYVLLR